MDTKTVVKESLSNEMISAGEQLTRRLDETGFAVSASLWFYFPEINTWRLILASPAVTHEGPKQAYKKIQSVISKMPKDPPKIPLEDITVLDSNDPLISLLRVAIVTANPICGIRFTQNVINGHLIEDAYIYRILKNG